MRFFGFVLITLIVCNLGNTQDMIFHVDFNDDSGSSITTEQISGNDLIIQNSFDRPERINANFGTALRLDGYSTFIYGQNHTINDFDSAYSIEIWFATEAFPKEPASIIECMSGEGGFQVQLQPYGRMNFTFFFNGTKRTLTPNKFLSKYRWHHIVMTIDGIDGEANIWVDGENWLSHNFSSESVIDHPGNSPLWIGKDNLNLLFAGFSLNTLNGAIDDIKVYDYALSPITIQETFELAQQLDVELEIDPSIRHAGDYLRPQFHAMPNTSWTNECYGLMYYGGKYHLFFQKNPNGPYLYFMHWGHLSSPDLVSWKEERIALAPSFGFDDFGVWSGTTALDPSGNPLILYTGVDGSKAGIGSAYPVDGSLIEWNETPGNPLIGAPPSGYPNKDFRDPFVFKRGDEYFMIVGSGLANNGGGILFSYTSVDLKNWTLINPVFQSNDVHKHGTFWEMPAMFPLDQNNYAVVITPQFNGKPAEVLYWIGSFDGQKFMPYFERAKPLELQRGNLLAPAFGQDKHGDWTYIGIIPEDRSVESQIKAGWRHTFSIPRQIRLLNDQETLAAIPHPNLCRLRMDSVQLTDLLITKNKKNNLPGFSTNQGELVTSVEFLETDRISLELFSSPTTSNKTIITLDKSENNIKFDRSQSSPYDTKENIEFFSYQFNPEGQVNLRIFLDHSTLEVFVDDLLSFSARVYPPEDGMKMDIFSGNGDFRVNTIKLFEMGAKESLYEDIICPGTELPDNLFVDTTNIELNNTVKCFPNPASTTIRFEEITNIKEIVLFDVKGNDIPAKHSGNSLDISTLLPGLYYGIVITSDEVQHFKFVKL